MQRGFVLPSLLFDGLPGLARRVRRFRYGFRHPWARQFLRGNCCFCSFHPAEELSICFVVACQKGPARVKEFWFQNSKLNRATDTTRIYPLMFYNYAN